MSELKANKISPAVGTSLVLGDAGDTVVFPQNTSDPAIDTNPAGGVGSMWLNTTSGEMFTLTDATAGANVWTNIGGGTGDVSPNPYMTATNTNGNEETYGNYKVVTFTTSGTFTPIIGLDPTLGNKVEYLVIAGGGGGGRGQSGSGGGGGAGGYRTATGFTVSNTELTVTIGAGGAPDLNGTSTVFSSITSTGGGYGSVNWDGASGGSGGGAAGQPGRIGGSSSAYGNDGGDGAGAQYYGAGGGGGSGSVGGDGTTSVAGNGGNGTSSSISGSAVTRAGGGGGCTYNGGTAGTGGSGGGGNGGAGGTANSGVAGTANLGSGGGGGSYQSASWGAGGAGGSGVVIIRYQFQ